MQEVHTQRPHHNAIGPCTVLLALWWGDIDWQWLSFKVWYLTLGHLCTSCGIPVSLRHRFRDFRIKGELCCSPPGRSFHSMILWVSAAYPERWHWGHFWGCIDRTALVTAGWHNSKQCLGIILMKWFALSAVYCSASHSILVLFRKIIVIRGTPSLFLQIVWKPSAIWHSKLRPHTGTATSSELSPYDTQQGFYLSVPWFSHFQRWLKLVEQP